jgi:hypothetical protein
LKTVFTAEPAMTHPQAPRREARTANDRAVQKVVAFLRHIEAFPTLPFAARRRHLSQARFLEWLTAMEQMAGARLVVVGESLSLTPLAVQMLDTHAPRTAP